RHNRATAVQRDPADIANLDAGYVHRLALPPGDRRGIRDLRRHRVITLPEGERWLMGEDEPGHREREQQQRDDRGKIAAMGGDRTLHGAGPVATLLRFGAAFLKQATPLRSGGACPGQAGRVASGGSTALPKNGPCELRELV